MSKTVGFRGCTYDAARKNGFKTFAVMHSGNFTSMRNEEGIIIHNKSNCINNPDIKINSSTTLCTLLEKKIFKTLNSHAINAKQYITQHSGSSLERYNAYNQWAVNTARHYRAVDGCLKSIKLGGEHGVHISNRYSTKKESRKIPFIVVASGVKKTALDGQVIYSWKCSQQNQRHIIGMVLIFLMNISGIQFILRILKEPE